MLKSEAINQLGGSISAVADAVGTTYQAVSKWPDVLPPRISDRVQAALYRRLTQANPPCRPCTDVAAPAGEAAHAG